MVTSDRVTDNPSLTVAWVALDHGVGRLKAGVGDLSHVQRLVVSLLRRDDRGVSHKREVNPEESCFYEEALKSCQTFCATPRIAMETPPRRNDNK